jgi:hypothetical protein
MDKTDELMDKIANYIESDGEYTPRGAYLLGRKIVDEVLIPARLVFMDEDQTSPLDKGIPQNMERLRQEGFKKVTPIKKVE